MCVSRFKLQFRDHQEALQEPERGGGGGDMLTPKGWGWSPLVCTYYHNLKGLDHSYTAIQGSKFGAGKT